MRVPVRRVRAFLCVRVVPCACVLITAPGGPGASFDAMRADRRETGPIRRVGAAN